MCLEICSGVFYSTYHCILGAYGYVHKGKAKGSKQEDKVIPIAAKVMKGKVLCVQFLPNLILYDNVPARPCDCLCW